MNDIVVGLLAVAIGLYLCLRGHWAMRVLLAIWGGFIGFALGAGIVDNVTGDGYLTTLTGWLVGIVAAVVVAVLAYLFYAVSVVLSMVSMGFVLGATVAAALDVETPWLLTVFGVVAGLLLGVLAVVADLPALLLVLLSAASGTSLVLGGLLLIVDQITLDQISEGRVGDEHLLWYVAWPVLFVIGIVVQLRDLGDARDRQLRETWSASPEADRAYAGSAPRSGRAGVEGDRR
ncbi:DUF4203 domain-containing protein [Nocardioides sambongensis]|uniref:DUF4203 domain-containing protein n=1 Tax=Nocardioides sambongensis TaxID=2589074 RepID=UPI0015E87698|nr:DUF4203 domain-containing protein [Nocardioides sambongensis]